MNQEVKTKKLINAPENIIAEMIEGMVGAHPDMLRVEGETGRAVVAVDGPRDGKVGIVVGEVRATNRLSRAMSDAASPMPPPSATSSHPPRRRTSSKRPARWMAVWAW